MRLLNRNSCLRVLRHSETYYTQTSLAPSVSCGRAPRKEFYLRATQRIKSSLLLKRSLSSSFPSRASTKMSDDQSYLSFLDSANKAPTKSSNHQAPSTSQKKSHFDPTISSSAVPALLKNLDVYYTSDTDSPFEPIFISYAAAKLPTADEFEQCVGARDDSGEVEELSMEDFDPRGEYREVVKKVQEASQGQDGVKVFRVGIGATRCEYYIVSLSDRGLVGVRAKAVES